MKFSITNAVAFTYFKGKLIMWAAATGIDIMGTECQRFPERQKMLVDSGASETMHSDHVVCCAEDFDVIDNGSVVKDGEDGRYERLGLYWESLNPGCYWGGRWKSGDSRHFGYRPKEEL